MKIPTLGPLSHFLSPVSWLISVTRSQVWMGSRCVTFDVIALTHSHTGQWKFNMEPHGKELSEDLKKRIVAPHEDCLCYKKIANNWAAARWPRPYSGLTGQVPLGKGLAMVNQWSWVHVFSIIFRGLQRSTGWGVSLSVNRPYANTVSNWSAWLSSQREASSKDDAQDGPQTVCWRQAG